MFRYLLGFALILASVWMSIGSDDAIVPTGQTFGATPAAQSDASILAEIMPEGGGDELVLTRVELGPEEGTGSHPHLGTRIIYVESGAIRYRLDSGEATVYRESDHTEGEMIEPGPDTWVELRAGDRVAESTDAAHEYKNVSDEPAVLLIFGLFPPMEGCGGGCH